MDEITLTKTYLDERLDEVLRTVKEGFDGTSSKADLEGMASKADLNALEQRMASKADLRRIEALMVTKSYLDDKMADLKGDLIVKLRKEDEKVNFLIALLRARKILSQEDEDRMRSEFQIFPSAL